MGKAESRSLASSVDITRKCELWSLLSDTEIVRNCANSPVCFDCVMKTIFLGNGVGNGIGICSMISLL